MWSKSKYTNGITRRSTSNGNIGWHWHKISWKTNTYRRSARNEPIKFNSLVHFLTILALLCKKIISLYVFRGHPLFLIRQLIFRRFLTELFAAKLCEYELNYKFTFKLNEHFADQVLYTYSLSWGRVVQEGPKRTGMAKRIFLCPFLGMYADSCFKCQKKCNSWMLCAVCHTTYVIF